MPVAALHVLVADDQKDVLDAIRLLCKAEGWQVTAVGSPPDAISAAQKTVFDVALIDLNYTRDTTSGAEGMALLASLKSVDVDLPVVVMTAWGSVHIAVEAMRLGAGDFIEKPWDNQRLLNILSTQAALHAQKRQNSKLSAQNALLTGQVDADFVAKSAAMHSVLETLLKIAPSDANVLLTGENGTGKSVIAQFIHARSRRSTAPFVKVNMGGIPETLFESEMFGHVRGAFTDAKADRLGRFELADGGSLFLDEIANTTPAQQAKLLRVLEEREFERVGSSRTQKVDVRLISATNADLKSAVNNGHFRQDLLFRLNTVEIRLPPLRDRREDILPLAETYIAAHAKRYGKFGLVADESAINAMLRYAWPGNVRELNHVLERAVLLCNGKFVRASDLQLQGGEITAKPNAELADLTLDEAEKMLIRSALDRHQGNVNAAADALGVSRSAMYRRLEKFGMDTKGMEFDPADKV
jgi:DNA-binding NtrC family response regulator